MVRKDRKLHRRNGMRHIESWRILYWLGVKLSDHRRIERDAEIAASMMSFFFPPSKFFDSDEGAPFRESLLLKQSERAKTLPDRRRHDSSTCIGKKSLDGLDDIRRQDRRYIRSKPDVSIGPPTHAAETAKVIRPIIAKRKIVQA